MDDNARFYETEVVLKNIIESGAYQLIVTNLFQ